MCRMNPFQRLARCWDSIHPYNAAQVMRLAIPYVRADVQTAWDAALCDLGLGQVVLRGRQYQHHAASGEVMELPPHADVEAFVADQLNSRFAPGEGPFRAFVQPDGHGVLAGIVYHHWIADSVSIRTLMREWFYRLTQCGQPRRQPVPMLREESAQATVGLRQAVRRFVCLARDLKTVRRLPSGMSHTLEVGHRVLRLPEHTGQRLHNAARSRGVKVTDLLLCTLAELCQRHLPAASARRPNLALGSIRDIRVARQIDDPDAFGAALAFSHVLCPATALSNRDALLRHIAEQTAAARSNGAGAANVDLRLALLALGMMRRKQQNEFFRKRMPFSAGLSNVDLSRTWVTQHPHLLTEFYRVSPAGPALPLVLTPTTAGAAFNLSLTWRKSAVSQTGIERIAADLRQALASWIESAQPVPAYEPAA